MNEMAQVNKAYSDDEHLDNKYGPTTQKPPDQILKTRTDQSAPEVKRRRSPRQHVLGFVIVLCALGFVEGISVNGLVSVSLTSIETRFELSSSQSGLIVSSADIGGIIFVLFVSFYGGRSHRPRVVGGGGFLLGLGSFLFVLPHVLVGKYQYNPEGAAPPVCEANKTDSCDGQVTTASSSASRFLPLFMIAHAVQGIGFTPAFTCGYAFIDDNSPPENTAVYIGVVYAITALGVAVGFVLGGQFLNIWTDVGRVDTDEITITSTDRRWVGAWWIGFACCCVLYVIISALLCIFPRYMQGFEKEVKQKEAEAKKPQNGGEKSIWQTILSFPKALFDLVRNPVYVLLVLVGAGDTLIVAGIASFAAKIIEEKFDVFAADAGLIMGGVTLLGGAGGMVIGGILIRKFRLELRGIMRLCLIFLVLATACGGGFFIHCSQPRFAGINSVYGLSQQISPSDDSLMGQCNANCSCNTRQFDPVCGQDGVTYFSACHAGCSDNGTMDGMTTTYDNCTCVLATLADGGEAGSGTAQSGECGSACALTWPFIVVLYLGITCTFMNVTPISMAILRCVPADKRSVGLGLQWVVLRLLGTIPGPILTGFVLDEACQLWQSTCDGRGSCWMYDRADMSWRLFLWWVAVKVASFLLLLLAYRFHVTRERAGMKTDNFAVNSVSNGMAVEGVTVTSSPPVDYDSDKHGDNTEFNGSNFISTHL